MCVGLDKKYLLFLSDSNENLILLTFSRKILNYHILWEPVQWKPSCSMRIDGQKWRS